MSQRYLVFLRNEEELRTCWEVLADDRFGACVEAWRRYRGMDGPDEEFPPDWTHPKAFTLG